MIGQKGYQVSRLDAAPLRLLVAKLFTGGNLASCNILQAKCYLSHNSMFKSVHAHARVVLRNMDGMYSLPENIPGAWWAL
jgi:hypothetical protein